jgi:hypothetical protein
LGNTLFPADNPWNEKITNAPVAANSAALVASIGLTSGLHADFGAGLYQGALIGIPFNVVSGTQPKVNVVIDAYASESDLLPIPIPANAVIEGDPLPSAQNTGDRHLLVYDKDNEILYETFNTHRPSEEPDNQWHADSEAVWDLSKDTFRTPGFTSADAAGLPILPGLMRPDEVLSQAKITHALRFTVPQSRDAYIFPASHQAGVNNLSYPRMGERFRLKQSFDISGFSPTNQTILQALKDYGMIVADNGSPWYLSGQPSDLWNNDDLHNLGSVVGSDFEAVDLTPLVSGLSQNTGPVAGGFTLTINGLNFSGGAGQTQVFFGSTPATSVTVLSDTQILVAVPTHAAGLIDVTVQSRYGASARVTADQFTFGSAAGQLQFSASLFNVNETAGVAVITVTRTSGTAGTVTVQYAASNGTAVAGTDYTATAGTLSFAAGDTSKTFAVPILDDNLLEGRETVNLTLSNPTGGALLGLPSTAVLTILEDDVAASPPPGNLLAVANIFSHSTEYYAGFVTRTYQALLGRAPDPTGLTGWIHALQGGLNDEQVEAYFLESPEFMNNHGGPGASWIRGLYQVLLARIPSEVEVQGWVNALLGGASPYLVAYDFAASPERESLKIQTAYRTLLGRPAGQSEVSAWVYQFATGAWTDETILAAFVASGEYYFLAPKGNGNKADWVVSGYLDVLHRPATTAEVDYWLGILH